MSGPHAELCEVARADRRYSVEAYEFLCHALTFTQKSLDRLPKKDLASDEERSSYHVTGQELVEGIRLFALEQFGMMAAVVFRCWGIRSTLDFGHMVYNLIDAGLWHRSDDDRLEDFEDLFDFDRAFVDEYEITWDEKKKKN